MKINKNNLRTDIIAAKKELMPDEDFINEAYDEQKNSDITDVLLIFSTPRSGSTFLTDLLYRSNLCLAHEYFQPFQYLPILAERWGAIDNLEISKDKFINSLIKYRTSEKGWLGINLHGEHLAEFQAYRKYFPNVNWHCLYLSRQDTLKQAVSYEIAVQTQKWSKFFHQNNNPSYSYKDIREKLIRINNQNNLILSYLNEFDCPVNFITYESLIENPIAILSNALSEDLVSHDAVRFSQIKKQSNSLNSQWYEQFSKEYFDKEKFNSHIVAAGNETVKSRIKRVFSKGNKTI